MALRSWQFGTPALDGPECPHLPSCAASNKWDHRETDGATSTWNLKFYGACNVTRWYWVIMGVWADRSAGGGLDGWPEVIGVWEGGVSMWKLSLFVSGSMTSAGLEGLPVSSWILGQGALSTAGARAVCANRLQTQAAD